MIRMILSSSSDAAKSYFSDSLAKADYYINDQELKGSFHGKLANRLGLTEEATKEQFFALCDNKNPITQEQLTMRTYDNRRIGYDINFHCPKSVSIIHAFSKDNHVMDIFQSSVRETMTEIEKASGTRVRKFGKTHDRQTGELVWSEFIHQTARPTENHAPDPHLHAHCFVFNATWDDVEKEYKAGQFGDIKRDMPFYQARFHKVLSDKLIDAGYEIRRTKSSFEIMGVPQHAIDQFSKRTNEIGQIAQEKGITDAKELDKLGAMTRGKKASGLSMDELRENWRTQIKESEAALEPGLESNPQIRYANPDTLKEKEHRLTAEVSVNHAVNHGFERASVMPTSRILAESYRHAIGDNRTTISDINNTLKEKKSLIHLKEAGRDMVTTHFVINEEREMVFLAKEGLGNAAPLYTSPPEIKGLQGKQKAAVEDILTNGNRVSIIRGVAGSGKTYLLKEAVNKIEAKGKQVTLIAPTAQASRGVLREDGFQKAETVAKFLNDPKMKQAIKGQVLWVDEAGLLGTKDMVSLLRATREQNARLVLMGDTRQHASVVRGDALRILNTVGGIQTSEVSQIRRQENIHYREAIQDLANGSIRSGFNRLDQIGFIKEIDPLNPNKELVSDYVQAVKNKRSALVISPTHAQGEKVTECIRKSLKDQRLVSKREKKLERLENTNLTESQKQDQRNFRKGQVIQFNQNVGRFLRGSMWSIDETKDGSLFLKGKNGNKAAIPFKKGNHFDVFEKRPFHLSKGDQVIVTRNAVDQYQHRMNNGDFYKVDGFTQDKKIVLVNPKSNHSYTVDHDFGHFKHGYVVTSHSSQGKTVDEVFISQPASTFPATDAKQFYVSASRGRKAAHIYTDDKEELLEHASAMGDRKSALELAKENGLSEDRAMERSAEKIKERSRTPERSRQKEKQLNYLFYEPER